MAEVGYSAGGPVIQAGQENEQGGMISRPAAFASGAGSGGGAPSNPLSNLSNITNALLPTPSIGMGSSGGGGGNSGGGLGNDIRDVYDASKIGGIVKNVGGKIWDAVKGAGAGDMGDAVGAAGAEEAAGGGPEDPLADVAAGATLAYGAGSALLHHFHVHL